MSRLVAADLLTKGPLCYNAHAQNDVYSMKDGLPLLLILLLFYLTTSTMTKGVQFSRKETNTCKYKTNK